METVNLKNSGEFLRAAMVCVNYSDLLAETLTRNLHHFKQVLIVTATNDRETCDLFTKLCRDKEVEKKLVLFATDAFYRDGATFNKWRAFEYGLNWYRREGWMCLMDADVIWPHELPDFEISIGQLCSPLRRMYESQQFPFPEESQWDNYPIHRNVNEWAGYSQIFHAGDPVLGDAPWHEVDWKHAGGADSLFQQKWDPKNKVRPPFEVLHIGPAGQNWYGRITTQLDGKPSVGMEELIEKRSMINEIWNGRRGKAGEERFAHEKIQLE